MSTRSAGSKPRNIGPLITGLQSSRPPQGVPGQSHELWVALMRQWKLDCMAIAQAKHDHHPSFDIRRFLKDCGALEE